jgi:hypothetical protein
MHKQLVGFAAAMLVSLWAASADASPIRGTFSIWGNFLPVFGDTGLPSVDEWGDPTFGGATGINFLNLDETDGTANNGQFQVIRGRDDFAVLGGAVGTIKDFTFAGAGSTAYPTLPIPGFESLLLGDLTFDLLSIAVSYQDANSLVLTGNGVFNWASRGFDATGGTFTLSGTSTGSSIAFSATEGALPTPEPTSMLLFGSGIAAMVTAVRRRRQSL